MALPRQRFHSLGERVRHGAPVEQVEGQEMIGVEQEAVDQVALDPVAAQPGDGVPLADHQDDPGGSGRTQLKKGGSINLLRGAMVEMADRARLEEIAERL